MANCVNCGRASTTISQTLGICADCTRSGFKTLLPRLEKIHKESRDKFGLPAFPPNDPEGVSCKICVNECRIPREGLSYCGLKTNIEGRLAGVSTNEANLEWHYDPLPTNCVADWVCAGGTAAGYPEFSYAEGPEYGYKNLAVFYNGCTFNCLYCQNWHWRLGVFKNSRISAEELAKYVNEATSCICYFGGDPSAQISHSIKVSKLSMMRKKGKILRICWETNGSANPKYFDRMAEISVKSGGCIKFDLKSYDEKLNIALCGVTNKRTLENFARLAEYIKERKDPPFLVASTLLVPGYVDEGEVGNIARFIASIDKNIPYSLLGFHPHFFMEDLPRTSHSHATRCLDVAKKAGLTRVRIGNAHLLGKDY